MSRRVPAPVDWLFFHAAPDIYNRKLGRLQKDRLAPSLFGVWEEALRLPGAESLEDSFLSEIEDYFELTREEALQRLQAGAEEFAHHFSHVSPDLENAAELEEVYDHTHLEVFELAERHARRFHDGPVNYVLALEAARGLGARSYLDYGSGIGSGAILFAQHGLEVTLADVSSPMLAFARWRLERRSLPYKAVHLRTGSLGNRTWDVITLLDVLEHVADPSSLVASIRKHLSPQKGLLIARAPFDDVRPQHIPHDLRTPSRFAALGYRYAWDYMGRNGLPIVLRVSQRGPVGNFLAGLIDVRLMGAASALMGMARSFRLSIVGRRGGVETGPRG